MDTETSMAVDPEVVLDGGGWVEDERALSMPEKARALKIKDAETYELAAEFLVDVKTLRKEAEDHHKPMIESAHRAHKAALAAKKKIDEPLAEAERITKAAITTYQDEEAKRRRAEEARLREQAQKLEDDQRLEAAANLEREGKADEAEAVIAAPPAPPVMSIPSSAPKTSGVKTSKSWDFKIEDEEKIPRKFLVVDEKKIRGVVRALGREANIPGVRVFEKSTIAATARR